MRIWHAGGLLDCALCWGISHTNPDDLIRRECMGFGFTEVFKQLYDSCVNKHIHSETQFPQMKCLAMSDVQNIRVS